MKRISAKLFLLQFDKIFLDNFTFLVVPWDLLDLLAVFPMPPVIDNMQSLVIFNWDCFTLKNIFAKSFWFFSIHLAVTAFGLVESIMPLIIPHWSASFHNFRLLTFQFGTEIFSSQIIFLQFDIFLDNSTLFVVPWDFSDLLAVFPCLPW